MNSIKPVTNAQNFTSRIVYEESDKKFSSKDRKFIENFDDLSEMQKFTKTRLIKEDKNFITYYAPNLGCYIKQQKNPNLDTKSELGTLNYEYEILSSAINPKIKDTDKALSYIETASGNKYLVSSPKHPFLMSYRNIQNFQPKTFKSILSLLDKFDEKGLQIQNLDKMNILIGTDGKAAISDFSKTIEISQLPEQEKPYETIFFPYFESKNNSNIFEARFLYPYLNKLKSEDAKDVLKTYLQIKSKFCSKKAEHLNKINKIEQSMYLDCQISFERAKAYVYENPTNEVLTAELLKMKMYNAEFANDTKSSKIFAQELNILGEKFSDNDFMKLKYMRFMAGFADEWLIWQNSRI